MANTGKGTEQPQFLTGWKEIANYLRKGVRTVQRYERELGLPVRRPAGKPTGSVVATKAELDAWVSASPIREAFQLRKQGTNASTAMIGSIREGLAEMARLREQMLGLRNGVRSSLLYLRENLYGLQGDLNRSTAPSKSDSVSLLDSRDKTEYMLELLRLDTRKAS